jgi:hypothetical protein
MIIEEIYQRCSEVASETTAYDKEFYNSSNSKLASHCLPVSILVQYLLGGEIVTSHVVYKGETFRHFFNKLPNGEYLDLTNEQFGTHRNPTGNYKIVDSSKYQNNCRVKSFIKKFHGE